MIKFRHKAAALALSAVMAAGMLTGCGSSQIDGTKTVMTINDDTIDLGLLSFYARYEQAWMFTTYSSWFDGGAMFDGIQNEESGKTIGDGMVDEAISFIQDLVLVSQHADEYGVTLSDEDNAAIEKAAQAFFDHNSEDVIKKVGATKEDVVKLLELMTIKSKMLEPLAADVDTEVSDEEAQQTSVSLITYTIVEDEETGDDNSEELLADAQKALDVILISDDPATADLQTIIDTIGDYGSITSQDFTTNDPSDSIMDSAVMEALKGLKDGEVYPEVIRGVDHDAFYIVRMDANNDVERTKAQKESIVNIRKNENYTALLEAWEAASAITIDDKVLATLKITDSEPYTFVYDEEETEAVTEDAE